MDICRHERLFGLDGYRLEAIGFSLRMRSAFLGHRKTKVETLNFQGKLISKRIPNILKDPNWSSVQYRNTKSGIQRSGVQPQPYQTRGPCAVGFAISPHWASDFSSTKLEPPKIPQLVTVSRLKEVTLFSGWVSVNIEPIIGQSVENECWWSCSATDRPSLSPTIPGHKARGL